jgi:hypothetical protein
MPSWTAAAHSTAATALANSTKLAAMGFHGG